MAAAWTLPLAGDATHRFLPWITGLMVFLAALALAGALGLGGAIERWESGHQGLVTVELPAPPPGQPDTATPRVLEVLAATPGVVEAAPLSADETMALLRPWLGDGIDGAALPLPVLIDVRLAPGAGADLGPLRAAVLAAEPRASVDDPASWLAPLSQTARTMQAIAYAIVALILVAGVATVAFTTTMGLSVHKDAIELLHLMGAEDGFIAVQFQRQAMQLGLLGGLIGLALAGGSQLLVARVAGQMAAPLLPRLALGPLDLVILAALPLATAGIALLVARLTVLRALARLP